MKHTFYTSEDCTCKDSDSKCWVCFWITEGGLGVCKVCGGAEGSLTTDCCGRKLTEHEEVDIYTRGVLDYVNGEWVNKPNPTHQIWKANRDKLL